MKAQQKLTTSLCREPEPEEPKSGPSNSSPLPEQTVHSNDSIKQSKNKKRNQRNKQRAQRKKLKTSHQVECPSNDGSAANSTQKAISQEAKLLNKPSGDHSHISSDPKGKEPESSETNPNINNPIIKELSDAPAQGKNPKGPSSAYRRDSRKKQSHGRQSGHKNKMVAQDAIKSLSALNGEKDALREKLNEAIAEEKAEEKREKKMQKMLSILNSCVPGIRSLGFCLLSTFDLLESEAEVYTESIAISNAIRVLQTAGFPIFINPHASIFIGYARHPQIFRREEHPITHWIGPFYTARLDGTPIPFFDQTELARDLNENYHRRFNCIQNCSGDVAVFYPHEPNCRPTYELPVAFGEETFEERITLDYRPSRPRVYTVPIDRTIPRYCKVSHIYTESNFYTATNDVITHKDCPNYYPYARALLHDSVLFYLNEASDTFHFTRRLYQNREALVEQQFLQKTSYINVAGLPISLQRVSNTLEEAKELAEDIIDRYVPATDDPEPPDDDDEDPDVSPKSNDPLHDTDNEEVVDVNDSEDEAPTKPPRFFSFLCRCDTSSSCQFHSLVQVSGEVYNKLLNFTTQPEPVEPVGLDDIPDDDYEHLSPFADAKPFSLINMKEEEEEVVVEKEEPAPEIIPQSSPEPPESEVRSKLGLLLEGVSSFANDHKLSGLTLLHENTVDWNLSLRPNALSNVSFATQMSLINFEDAYSSQGDQIYDKAINSSCLERSSLLGLRSGFLAYKAVRNVAFTEKIEYPVVSLQNNTDPDGVPWTDYLIASSEDDCLYNEKSSGRLLYDASRVYFDGLDSFTPVGNMNEIFYSVYFLEGRCFGNNYLRVCLPMRLGRSIPLFDASIVERWESMVDQIFFPPVDSNDALWTQIEDYHPYVDNMPNASRKKHLDFFQKFLNGEYHYARDDAAFVKHDEMLFSIKGRSIINPPPSLFFLLCNLLKRVKKAFKETTPGDAQETVAEDETRVIFHPVYRDPHGRFEGWFTYGADLTCFGKKAWMNYARNLLAGKDGWCLCVGGDDTIVLMNCRNAEGEDSFRVFEGDVTACDQSHNEVLIRSMISILKRMGANDEELKVLFDSYFRPIKVKIDQQKLKVFFLKPQLHTGHPQTSVANTLVVCIVATWILMNIFLRAYEDVEDEEPLDLDVLATKYARQVGMLWKCQVLLPSFGTFHKGFFLYDADCTWMPLPSTVWKMTKMRASQRMPLKTILIRIAFSCYQKLLTPQTYYVLLYAYRHFRYLMETLYPRASYARQLVSFYRYVSKKELHVKYTWGEHKNEEFQELPALNFEDLPFYHVAVQTRDFQDAFFLNRYKTVPDYEVLELWDGSMEIRRDSFLVTAVFRDYGCDTQSSFDEAGFTPVST